MMNVQEILVEVKKSGAALVVLDGKLKAAPVGALSASLKAAIRERAPEIKAALLHAPADPDNGRATWPRSITPDSRSPLIPPEVRAKIEAIESEARRLGWPGELLWNANFWDCPRGLAAILDRDDEIAEVTAGYITILKTKSDLLRFNRRDA